MKSKIKESKETNQIGNYPCLKKSKDSNLIVLFTHKECVPSGTGMVVYPNGDYDIGHYSRVWDEDRFELIQDKVILEN